MLLGGIEAGGTKMVCALADEFGHLLDRVTIPTILPDSTIDQMVEYFKGKSIDALGIGSFGPLDLNPSSPTYGFITTTPKPGWKNIDFFTPFKVFNVPIGFDTDVNAAILGEVRFGAAVNTNSAIYITVGTGVGVGVYLNGQLLHGYMHPEAGHILLKPYDSDKYIGCCPYHSSCLEGMASGSAIMNRWGSPAEELYDRDDVWKLESYYIGQAIVNYILTYSPQKVVLWGGVMHKEGLMEQVRREVQKQLGGYVSVPDMRDYIVAPVLGDDPGIIGATQLGYDAMIKG